jgi:hypothetical protein
VKAGILEERDEDLAAHILADPNLTDKQKRALLEVYLSFRQGRAGEPGTAVEDVPGKAADAEEERG